jgi:ubiquinone/menaquinone biosynthesis C-methylase UbiE
MSSESFLDAASILPDLGLESGMAFLDAGSGPGHFSLAAAQIVGETGCVFAVDVHCASIAELRARAAQADADVVIPICLDLTAGLPLTRGSVDFVLMSNVLHGLVHNEEANIPLQEIGRVLRPGGIFAVIEFKKEQTQGPPLRVRLSPTQVNEVITPYSFRHSTVLDVGAFNYAMKFVRV